ncbi:hypothetical protein ACQYWQ_25160 [Streptomyces sp. P6-2-1]|uniref:hypothetical protein n=1 Tax=Streptomyces sp. P6-2-1 TaxID=3422591 RepID=UPI003D36D634
MAREFGHHLGLPHALPALPLTPLVRAYDEVLTLQHDLGPTWWGEALCAPGERLSVLDGVFASRPPLRRRHLGPHELRARAQNFPERAALLTAWAERESESPGALRRALLYELTRQTPLGASAAELPEVLDTPEREALAAALTATPRLNARQERAARELADLWHAGRLRTLVRHLALLPVPARAEAAQAAFSEQVERRTSRTDALLDRAAQYERSGLTREAAGAYLRAARLATDCPTALRGLVRTHTADSGSQAPLRARLRQDGGVDLDWDPADTRTYDPRSDGRTADVADCSASDAADVLRIVRLEARQGSAPVLAEIARLSGGQEARDPSPPPGSRVRYAIVPLHAGHRPGPPLVSDPVEITPQVSAVTVRDAPASLHARWTPPPGATAVRLRLEGPAGLSRETCGESVQEWTWEELPTGPYRLALTAEFRTPEGTTRCASARRVTARVHPWPSPVHGLFAEDVADGVRLRWEPERPERGEISLVEWPDGAAPPVGEHLTDIEALAPLSWEPADEAGTFRVPAGPARTVGAVAVLGARALTGPTVRIRCRAKVNGLRAERLAPGRARLIWDWPPDTPAVTVLVQQNGTMAEHAVTRSAYLRQGCLLDLAPSAALLTVRAESAAEPAALLVSPADSSVPLSADLVVSYALTGGRRLLRAGPSGPRVHVRLRSAAEPADEASVPEFVLVARVAQAGAPHPRNVEDGVVVLRVSGTELARRGAVELPLPRRRREGPFLLRAFLVGGNPGARLEEPPLTSLVVH